MKTLFLGFIQLSKFKSGISFSQKIDALEITNLMCLFVHNCSTYTAEKMVVVDETSKDRKTLIRKYGCATRGHDPVYTVSLNQGICYSAVPVLTMKGYIAACAVEGSIDGGELYDFIANDVVGPLNFALTFELTAMYS